MMVMMMPIMVVAVKRLVCEVAKFGWKIDCDGDW